MNTNSEKRTLPWRRINQIESFSISVQQVRNFASILEWNTYETEEAFHPLPLQRNLHSLNSTTNNLSNVDNIHTKPTSEKVYETVFHASAATCDHETVAIWSWGITPLPALAANAGKYKEGPLDLRKLAEDPRLGRYFQKEEEWLLGGALMERRLHLVEKWIEFGRVNPILEYGVAGAIVVVKDTQSVSRHQGLPRRNYLQNVGYGVIEDPKITPYLRRGFVISSLHDTERVVMVAPASRVARRDTF